MIMKKNDIEREFNKLIDSMMENTPAFRKENRCNCSAQMGDESIEKKPVGGFVQPKDSEEKEDQMKDIISAFNYLLETKNLKEEINRIKHHFEKNSNESIDVDILFYYIDVGILFYYYDLFYKLELIDLCSVENYMEFLVKSIEIKIKNEIELYNLHEDIGAINLIQIFSTFIFKIKNSNLYSDLDGKGNLEEPEEDSECVYCFKFKC